MIAELLNWFPMQRLSILRENNIAPVQITVSKICTAVYAGTALR